MRLKGCVQNSLRVLDYIASALGTDTVISLMSQFTPNGEGEPRRKLGKLEYKVVKEINLSSSALISNPFFVCALRSNARREFSTRLSY